MEENLFFVSREKMRFSYAKAAFCGEVQVHQNICKSVVSVAASTFKTSHVFHKISSPPIQILGLANPTFFNEKPTLKITEYATPKFIPKSEKSVDGAMPKSA